MKLKLKSNKLEWLKLKDGSQIKIDYPTIEQHQNFIGLLSDKTATDEIRGLKAMQYLIKVTIKDWKGFNDASNGKEIKCKIVDNELDDNLHYAICMDAELTVELGTLIMNQIGFGEGDKKK